MVKKDYDVPRARNPKQRLCGNPTEQQRDRKGRRELYAGGEGCIEEDELRPQNKDIMDEIDGVGAARENPSKGGECGQRPETERGNRSSSRRN